MDDDGMKLYQAWQRKIMEEEVAWDAWADYAHDHRLCLHCTKPSGRHSYCDECRSA